ncbi:hypothetical protein DCO58_00575 [Helicobacter saguini]|uniref:Beta sliding clamp n=1 Tax=Helicobacter saguini TaxID=1548018 RepID=A0A347VQY0_9HELI|nr:DNA polymerase III subunit beta [Helicobacter saguini]MWV63115.1 hypothetical protein [Helicobacter saguini]MWV66215.1 hypothetical protein [Helicobacter saguini]MWV68565.1 hypothetical protein [Helicobacter saguini]MWV71881.1 hypothetical protein [Helicobacter saguini]TLD95896.1 hypothetical protein LS64_000580 [Helicobacter saguini]
MSQKNILTIQKNKLEQAISTLGNAYNKKETFDLSSSILLETDGNALYLKATNNEAISMKLKVVPDSIEGKIFCAVKGEFISECIKQGLDDSEVIIEYDDKKDILHIKQKNYNAKIPVYKVRDTNSKDRDDDLNDFPFKDDYKTTQGYKKIDIDNKLLTDTFKNIIHCCDEKNASRIYTQGVLLQIESKVLTIVATDTLRLAYIETEYPNDKIDFSCIIPKKGIVELVKFFGDNFDFYIKEIDIEKANEENEYEEIETNIESVCFVAENMEIYVRTINSKFPEFKKVIEKERGISINVKRDSLLKALQRVNGLCSASKIIFYKDKITIESLHGRNNSEVKDIIDNIELNLQDEIEISMTNKHIIECLANAKVENIDIYIEEYAPILFDAKDFKEIIVPEREYNYR